MWTQDALASEARAYAVEVWRIVENQHKTATIGITDTLEEQHLLEEMLDRSKPKYPQQCAGLDYLLATPFRYWPYERGSRFRRARQPDGAFYAGERVETAVAEQVFYSLLVFAESPGTKRPERPVVHTGFCVACRAKTLIDLTCPPLDRDAAIWTDLTNYEPCQDLADMARAARIEAIRYMSVRDPDRGANVAVLSPKVFAASRPKRLQTWRIFIRQHAVQAWCEAPHLELEFRIDTFSVDPRLQPLMAHTLA